MKQKFLFILMLTILLLSQASAQVPQKLSYQGVLTDHSGNVINDGSYTITFHIYDQLSGGTNLWTEKQNVSIQNGIFNINLGSQEPLDITFDRPLFLGITINEDAELSPRIELSSSAYSFRALSVEDSVITNSKIQNNAITANKIEAGHVVKSLNGLTDAITLEAGANVSIQNTGNNLKISATGGGSGNGISSVIAGQGLTGGGSDGEVTLSLDNPLSLSGSSGTNAIIYGKNDGQEAAIRGENNFGTTGLLANNQVGVYGSHPGFGDNGVYFGAIGGGAYGARGTHQSTFNTGLLGTNLAGVEAFNAGGTSINYGYIASESFGVYGEYAESENYGFLGSADYGLYGEHGSTGNYAAIAGSETTVLAHNKARNTVGSLANQFGVRGEHLTTGNLGYLGGPIYAIRGEHLQSRNFGILGADFAGVAGYAGDQSNAGYFEGNVEIRGRLTKSSGSFKIDHPLDPANKYLSHSFVESPDMMNIYNGNVQLDASGEAQIIMPEWFEALNIEFRYQLTSLGAPGPNLYIAEEISDNRFRIAGGKPYSKISWQVTGIRNDVYARENRIQVEEYKEGDKIGKYLNPKEHGQPENLGINYRHDDEIETMRETRIATDEKIKKNELKKRSYQQLLQKEN